MRLTVSLRFSPTHRIKVGTLFDLGRDTAFEYDRGFLATGLNLAPFRLPPRSGILVYDRSGNMDTFGVFEDSLSDGWGRRLVDVAYRQRFGRLHVASAAGLLHADFRTPGDEYALLFKLTDALTHDYSAKEELFRRATLNVLEHNRDDHLKNFAFLMDEQGRWSLAPFYDFTYSDGPNGWQTLSVAGEGANPTQADLDRLAHEVGLRSL